MLIEGPLNIDIVENSTGGCELHLEFTPQFKALKLPEQSDAMHEFVHYLKTEIDILEEHDPNRHGMLMILQVAEELLPKIDTNKAPLEEAIVVNIPDDSPFGQFQIKS